MAHTKSLHFLEFESSLIYLFSFLRTVSLLRWALFVFLCCCKTFLYSINHLCMYLSFRYVFVRIITIFLYIKFIAHRIMSFYLLFPNNTTKMFHDFFPLLSALRFDNGHFSIEEKREKRKLLYVAWLLPETGGY